MLAPHDYPLLLSLVRVDLEFDVARLVALEPALGGAWGRSFLQRLMREGAADPAAGAAAGRQQGGGYAPRRRKVGPRAREAVLAAAYPITVETRCGGSGSGSGAGKAGCM